MSAERCAQPVQGPRGALATALTPERSSADAYRTASTGLRGAVERHAPSLDDVTEGLPEGGPHSDAIRPRTAHARRSAAAPRLLATRADSPLTIALHIMIAS